MCMCVRSWGSVVGSTISHALPTTIFHIPKTTVKPEDLDSLLQQMDALVRDEQQWARLASACVGAGVGLAAFPTHDFFGVLAGGWVDGRMDCLLQANPSLL